MLNKTELEDLRSFAGLPDGSTANDLLIKSKLDPSEDFIGFDFGGLYLPNINLSGFNLCGCNFENAILYGAKFCGANLTESNFKDANIRRAEFEGAITKHADFTGVFAEHATGLSLRSPDARKKYRASVLFIEDEPNSVQLNTKLIYDLFPWINIVFEQSEVEGARRLKSDEFIVTIIDARIPKSKGDATTGLLGRDLSEQLSKEQVVPRYKEMRHAILTEHKPAIKVSHLTKDEKRIGVIEKGEDIEAFDDVLHCIYSMSVPNLREVAA